MRTTNAVGQYGEDLAARHLVDNGFTILDRNWRCAQGEIDIVAREGHTLVVCEVKTRRGLNYGSPLESITYRKLSTLRQLVGRWLQAHEVRPDEIRIDAVSVLLPHQGAPSVDHVRGVA
ncbi:YraN family protein [Kribbella sp. CA-293567]|uniref:YraN family protein n=1 Tax=Kribbella sp. CA-293567 TaxID=3002436 RepID=UPI0022DD4CBB|nr:YraN family protein [Kribbella sp. CA-293567]WBQ07712.1 YraN family protein [Kribbella sp. CA-293567]